MFFQRTKHILIYLNQYTATGRGLHHFNGYKMQNRFHRFLPDFRSKARQRN